MKVFSKTASLWLAILLLVYQISSLQGSVPEKDERVVDIIRSLSIGTLPENLPTISSDRPSHERPVAAHVPTDKDPTDRFKVKHVNPWQADGLSSYDELIKPGRAKEFLIEINANLFGGILQGKKNTVPLDTWLGKFAGLKVTIIDASYEDINAAGKSGTDVSKEHGYDNSGGTSGGLYETNREFDMTHIILTKTADNGIEIKIEKYQTKAKLGYTTEGNVWHFEEIGGTGKIPGKDVSAGTISKADLETNAGNTDVLWKTSKHKKNWKSQKGVVEVDRTTSQFENALNTLYEKNRKAQTPPSCRGKRAVGSGGCSISPGLGSDLDPIIPKQFLEDYNNADSETKRKLAKILENDMDRMVDIDIDTRKNLEAIVQNEKFKEHLVNLEKMADMQDLDKIRGGDPSKIVDKFTDLIDLDNPKTKISSSKVSQSIANSKYTNKFAKRVGDASGPMNAFFLAKSLVNGIRNNDTTSLAILGATVGFDLVTDGIAAFGENFFKVASKAGKATKALGKAAGPIGAVADIGLNIWSLTKSVQRLQNATNKYERNDAIADIVADSVSIAVTAVTTSLSIAFPPAAPLIMAVGFVIEMLATLVLGIFKAANEVARINSEIQLSSKEKKEVFWSRALDWFGTRKKNYIDYLLEEKEANDAAVKGAVRFLQENIDFLGIVMPSRTFSVDDSCTLTVRHCAFKIFGRCARWEARRTLGTRCSRNKACGGTICQTYNRNINSGYNEYICTCHELENFSAPRKDSRVDFRRKQNLKWDRSVPSDVSTALFKCKPGRTSGFDPRATQSNYRTEFLCEHAIGILQPTNRRKSGQTMLFDLEDGNDNIHLDTSDRTPNMFIVGAEGTKNFYGGGGPNEFFVNGSCTRSLRGVLSGGGSTSDSISLGTNCAKGAQMKMDFTRNLLSGPSNNVYLTVSNVEQISGRLNEGDFVIASTSTKMIALNSGSSRIGDIIEIPTPSCTTCRYNLTVYAGEYTTINSKAGLGEVTTLFEQRWRSTSATFNIHSESRLTNNIMFLKTPSKDIMQYSYSRSTTARFVAMGLRNARTGDVVNFRFNFQPNQNFSEQQTIFFAEDLRLNSVLVVSLANSPFVYHKLTPPTSTTMTTTTRVGTNNLENIFEILSPLWSVQGGSLSDEFILQTATTSSTNIDGGGGDDTLRLHENLKSRVTINLLSTSPVRNIETIIGHPGNPATITCHCNTKLVALQGGSAAYTDVVNVGPGRCPKRDLQIVAKGRTAISIVGEVGTTKEDSVAVLAIPSENSRTNLMQVSITTNSANISGFYVTAQLTHANWNVENIAYTSSLKNALKMKLKYSSEYIDMHFMNLGTDNSNYVSIPYVQLLQNNSDAPPGQLLINKEDLSPQLLFYLNKIPKNNGESPTRVQGLRNVKNFFQIENGTWHVIGGDKDDVFVINPTEAIVNIEGGGGDNTLVFENGTPQLQNRPFVLNFEQQQIGFAHLKNIGNRLTKISNVFGRINKPDIIQCGCDTKAVNGRQGLQIGLEDEIRISELNCPQLNHTVVMNIAVPSFTKVENTAVEGIYSYHIEDVITSTLNLTATEDNLHLVDISFNPWEIIEDVGFSPGGNQLALKFVYENSTRIQIFEMSRHENSSQFTNPVFEFHRPDSSVTSDIQVSADGVTASTIVIQGRITDIVKGIPVDINRILVNITEPGNDGGIIFGSDKSSANQFWLFDLQSPVELLRGGGQMSQNYLDLGEDFGKGQNVEIDLSNEFGSVKINGTKVVSILENIQHFQGRVNPNYTETVYVSGETGSVSEVEHVVVRASPKFAYNLTIGINLKTTVEFEKDEGIDYKDCAQNIFTYKFSSPRSFNLDYEESTLVKIATHTYLLAITLDQLESMKFELDEEILYYDINGTTFNHEMIGGILDGEQFYPQPVMITQDGFRIQVDASGGIYLTLGAGSSFPTDAIRSTIIPVLSQVAKETGATIIIQTDEEFVYVGHGEMEGDRNVLQSVGYSESHLVGGGATDTIYDIADLTENVYIYPGFHSEERNLTEEMKQTVDLTDIVAPIRTESGRKYIPKIGVHKDDLYIEMEGYEDEFPGKVFIVDGTKPENARRLQFLLSNSLMDLVADGDHNWNLKPRPLYVPEGALYTLAKEDFEDGQEIRVEDSSSSKLNSNTTFQSVRNGTDLIMTTLLDPEAGINVEMTTVVILGYFEDSAQPLQRSVLGVTNNNPPEVLHLKVSLPGLDLTLTGSSVQNTLQINTRGGSIPALEIPSWDSVIQTVEDRLMKRMANLSEII